MTKITYQDLELPNYLNTRMVFGNLDVSDLAKAAVLAPLNILLVGDTGTGKSQLATDIYHYYFGGNKTENGQGVFIRAHPEIDIYNEIFTNLSIERAQRELTDNLEAKIFFVDELNRAPSVAQNQFFGLGDGVMDYRGRSVRLGKDGYHILVGTANLGNGEFQGTFETDKAMYNRLHVALDFDYKDFKPTGKDQRELNRRKPNPNVKKQNPRDISDKILTASKEIERNSENLGLETLAVIDYLTFGLDNCQRNLEEGRGNGKGEIWPMKCQDCKFNPNDGSLCSLIRAPKRRTLNSLLRYANALQYLAELKNPEIIIDPIDLIFKSFELTGAYQFLLNPHKLRQDHCDQNPEMMAEIAKRLKEDFRKNEDFIMSSLEQAKKGNKTTTFFKHNGKLGDYNKFSEERKTKVQPIKPFHDNREIGLSYMLEVIDEDIERAKSVERAD